MSLKAEDRTILTSGDFRLDAYSVKENGEVYEPEVVVVKKGPYKIHMSVLDTPSDFIVQQMKIDSWRPAILGPENFANLKEAKLGDISSINELEAI